MFDFINTVAPDDAIAGVHFALRRISYRSPEPTAVSVHVTDTEPVTTEERIGLKILNEIIEEEKSPIERLTETKANQYKEKLLEIADELSQKEFSHEENEIATQDDRAGAVLKEWETHVEMLGPRGPLSNVGAIMLGAYLVLFTIALLCALFALWPRWDGMSQYWSSTLNILVFYRTTLDLELRLLLIAAAAGGLGNLIHTLRSFVFFVGNRALVSSWVLWYVTQPLFGMAAALVVYFILRSTPLLGSPPESARQFYLIASVSSLVGLFSERATFKLQEIFDTVFRARPRRGP